MKALLTSAGVAFHLAVCLAQPVAPHDNLAESALQEVAKDTMTIMAAGAPASISDDAPSDSLAVEDRFRSRKLDELRNDPELNYKQPPTIAQSFWARFWAWIAQLIDDAFDTAVHTNWGRVVLYLLGLALLIVIVMMVLKVNAFRVLYFGESKQKYQVLEENIHEMDFDKLIQLAVAEADYRRAVRLLFLYALKLLSDRHLIHWQAGKTNHDYVAELGANELRGGFNELSFYFEYAWYGNFGINEAMFRKVQDTFSDWRSRLK